MDEYVSVEYAPTGTMCEIGTNDYHAAVPAIWAVCNGVSVATLTCSGHLADAVEVCLMELADKLEPLAV